MKWRIVLLALLSGCLRPSVKDLATAPPPTDWRVLALGKDGYYEIAADQIRRVNNIFVVTVRAHSQTPRPNSDGKLVSNTVTRELVDCRGGRLGTPQMIAYGPNGDVVDSYDFPLPQLSAVIPDTRGDEILRSTCDFISKYPDLVHK